MFTARELKLILNALESEFHELATEITRRKTSRRETAPLPKEREELDTLIVKVRDLFLEA